MMDSGSHGGAGRAKIGPLYADKIREHMTAFIAVAADQPSPRWGKENFLRSLPYKWRLSMVAWHDETPIGYTIVSRKAPTRAHLHHFMIRTDFRNQGLGNRMMAELEKRARKHGFSELTLKVEKASLGARRFYSRLGYRQIDDEGQYILYGKPMEIPAEYTSP